jgi:hypothetical protein
MAFAGREREPPCARHLRRQVAAVDSTIPPRAMSDPSLIRLGASARRDHDPTRIRGNPSRIDSDSCTDPTRADSDRAPASESEIDPCRPATPSADGCHLGRPADGTWAGATGDRWPGARRSRAREGHPELGRGAAQNSPAAPSPLRRRMGRGAVVNESSCIRATVDRLNADQRAKGGRGLSRRAHSGRASSTVDAAHFSRPRPSGG